MSKSLFATLIISAAIAMHGCISLRESVAEPPVSAGETAHAAHAALRVRADLARGRRWELGWGEASVYDTASGELVRTIQLPGATMSGAHDSCLPDMLLDRSGALIVSSNVQPRLWRISPSRLEVEVYDIELDSDTGKDVGFTRLAWGVDQHVLHAVSASTGALWSIDMASGSGRKVGIAAPIFAGCGQ